MESWKNVVNVLYVILSADGEVFLGGEKVNLWKTWLYFDWCFAILWDFS